MTQVFYGTGASANAAKIATAFGENRQGSPSLPAGHVEILLGTGSTAVLAGLTGRFARGGDTPPLGLVDLIGLGGAQRRGRGAGTVGARTPDTEFPACIAPKPDFLTPGRSSVVLGATRPDDRRQGWLHGLLSCLRPLLVVVSGYAHKAVADLNALRRRVTIGGSSSVGAMNILVMGLESRTTFYGQELDHHLQYVMHIGSIGAARTPTR